MYYLTIRLISLFIITFVVNTVDSCVCTQPLNPRFLCVDEECEDSLIHHYCNSYFVIKILVISDKLYSAIPGTFSTRVGYKFKLVHAYKFNEKGAGQKEPETNIVWTTQDSCGASLKKGRLYIISGSVDDSGLRTTSCDFIRSVKKLRMSHINFFGYSHKFIDCSKIVLAENSTQELLEYTTEQSTSDQNDKNEQDSINDITKLSAPQIRFRPILPDRSCYCGPTPGPGISSVNIGLGAANNNGENGWSNVQGGLNLAIASGNGNSGHGISSTGSNGAVCGPGSDGSGNGNGGVNIGIASGNNNGGHGFNIGNGGNNVGSDVNGYGGIGGHNVGHNSGNGNGGQNIGIISGNGNTQNGWNIGNGGNNADDNTMNSDLVLNTGSKSKQGENSNLGHGGNNVGDNSGNGNGGKNWGLWSGNENGFHGWHTGNGGNNAGDNVGNGFVVMPNDEQGEFVAHNSGIGGNNRGNNTGNGKGGSLSGFGSGQNNGISSWNSGNGGNNVGNNSGNGVIGSGVQTGLHRKPGSGRKPGIWTSGVGNGGNNVGTNSGNGFGTNSEFKEVMNGFILGLENRLKGSTDKTKENQDIDKNQLKKLLAEIESENMLDDDKESFEKIE